MVKKLSALFFCSIVFLAGFTFGGDTESELKELVPYYQLKKSIPGLTLRDYNRAISDVAKSFEKPSSSYSPYSTNYSTSSRWSSYSYPKFGSSYDTQAGNSYNWSRYSNGTTHLNGYNLRTGSSWSTTYQKDGSMSGFDKNSNYWSYDRKSSFYMNYGTGVICIGEGLARTCY